MAMRVIAGLFKSRTIRAPRGDEVRPTSDRVRESLFSILAGEIDGSSVLDLFAGAGTLGIEAVSRGAKFVTFVEMSSKVVGILKANLESLGIEDRTAVFAGDVFEALEELSRRRSRFGVVFIDPPYYKGTAQRAVEALARSGLVGEGGTVVVEHESRRLPLEEYNGLKLSRRVKFGETAVSIYRRHECQK
jgi:16S rRNA (guanine966-N2)-methyltransferase